MKAIKKINNNVAICEDDNKKELIAFGKGIGFPAMPYQITDLSSISMTFYRMDKSYYKLLEEIPEEVFEVAAMIVKKAQITLNCNLNPNLLPGLADHINFALTRLKKFKKMKMLFSYDVEQLYPTETSLGRYAVKLIQKKLLVKLPESEITNIAMHFVNAEEENINQPSKFDVESLIEVITKEIEQRFEVSIDRKGFNYNRFIMHLRYYLKRLEEKRQFVDDNGVLFEAMKEENPLIYECAIGVSSIIEEKLHAQTTQDETLYLMIHISRIIKNNTIT
ncbi:transcriptional regulator [Anaerocolumna cellulosilytica]|uniref:Transcriptional regulator n=1 Tax=Anaerocolumna cellulosilytica TaxID=433286 RepID=A0A6S6R0T7_9FIRM|nr:PRD domain-containing protein [Anaerocolumna cellulosilytica]MBB5195755.1 beta-glucoside operon transcriptional antiterminator [Anaerocolumna cellulosilytica]BCJ92910.1 transcriptional regulator [Anaerocolumna cellulosilytica]